MSLVRNVITRCAGVTNARLMAAVFQSQNTSFMSAVLSRSQVNRYSTASTKSESSEQSSESVPPENGKPKEEASCPGCTDLSRQLADSVKERKELDTKINDLTDKYKRALAEMENVRNRLMKQTEDAKLFAVQSFAKDLLVVADTLTHAAKCVSTASSKINDDGNFRALYDGLVLTDNQLHQVFKKHGLVKVNPAVGDKFDPKFHEALFQQDATKGEASGSISNVQKVGYALRERCVRPAVVGVFK